MKNDAVKKRRIPIQLARILFSSVPNKDIINLVMKYLLGKGLDCVCSKNV